MPLSLCPHSRQRLLFRKCTSLAAAVAAWRPRSRPGLRRQLVVLGELLGKSGERDLLLQVPQRGAVVLEAVQVIGILASQLRVDALGPLVVVQLEVSLGHVVEHKARVELRVRQQRQVLERLVALELLEVVVGVGELLVDAHELLDETCLIGTEQLARRRRCNQSRRGCGCCCCRCCFGLFKARTERHLLLMLLLIGGEEGGLRLVGEQVAVATLGVCGRRAAVLVLMVLMVVDVNDVVVGVHGVQIGAFLIVVVGDVDGDGDHVLLLLLVVLVVVVRARGGAFLQALSLDLRRRRR